jgi:transaldolase
VLLVSEEDVLPTKPVVSVGATTNPTLKQQKIRHTRYKIAHQNMKDYITKISHKIPKFVRK